MRKEAEIAVVIPALNEARSVGKVIRDIPPWVDRVCVVDNGSDDGTPEVAREAGAEVIVEPRRGYGSACLAGIASMRAPDILVFLDADYSDDPREMEAIVAPILQGQADLVIGSRTLGARERGALTPQARFGNWIACALLRLLWGAKHTDLGPFRAIRRNMLEQLAMADTNFGWTVEMQVKAAKRGLRVEEVPVSYRKRIGKSKISGTVKGVVSASAKILYTIAREALRRRRSPVTRDRLIVFTRYPVPGETKTRLIPELGPEGAAALQKRMTEHAIAIAEKFADDFGADVVVSFSGAREAEMAKWLGSGLRYQGQQGDDLGERMHHALKKGRLAGMDRTILVGTDCPGITPEILRKAFETLAVRDCVFGPADDGGYYLVGMREPRLDVFEGIEWGTSQVHVQSLAAVKRASLSVESVDKLGDIDSPEDLHLTGRLNL